MLPNRGRGCCRRLPARKLADCRPQSRFYAVTYVIAARVKPSLRCHLLAALAVKIVNAAPKETAICFVPDENLGRVGHRTTGRPMTVRRRVCPYRVSPRCLLNAQYPVPHRGAGNLRKCGHRRTVCSRQKIVDYCRTDAARRFLSSSPESSSIACRKMSLRKFLCAHDLVSEKYPRTTAAAAIHLPENEYAHARLREKPLAADWLPAATSSAAPGCPSSRCWREFHRVRWKNAGYQVASRLISPPLPAVFRLASEANNPVNRPNLQRAMSPDCKQIYKGALGGCKSVELVSIDLSVEQVNVAGVKGV